MTEKFGTVIDKDLFAEARRYCRQSNITIRHLIEQALTQYLERSRTSKSSTTSIDASFGNFKISESDLLAVLEEDMYDTE